MSSSVVLVLDSPVSPAAPVITAAKAGPNWAPRSPPPWAGVSATSLTVTRRRTEGGSG